MISDPSPSSLGARGAADWGTWRCDVGSVVQPGPVNGKSVCAAAEEGTCPPGAFNFSAADLSSQTLTARLLYFSMTTLTTVGYGDITPINPVARSLANLEGIIGQLFPAITLARLVSMQLSQRQQRGE